MRSSEPIPGEPWPHEMTFTVDDRPNTLLELLWIREAHELHPHGDDLPPLLVDTPTPVHDTSITAETRSEWEAGWPRVWRAVAEHAGLEKDRTQFERIRETADGSPERAGLLRLWVGPTWRDKFGDSAFANPHYALWEREGLDAHRASRPRSLESSPERRDLPALIAAWLRGLTKVVTIPCRGDYFRKISPSALLTTAAIRDDSAAYQRALASFD